MLRKVDRALNGPSWAEVIFGAILSVILGVALGAVLLVARPVVGVKELPKEEDRSAKAVYYIEGTKDVTKGREAPAKRKAFLEGQSVTVTEDDLNALVGANPPWKTVAATTAPKPAPAPKVAEKAKPGEKAKTPEASTAAAGGDEDFATLGVLNFRVNGGALQMAVPITFNFLGLSRQVVAQARGSFVSRDNVFVYEPSEVYFGSCPVHRLPYASDYARVKLSSIPIPDDIKTSWSKLAKVSIEGKALKLTMP